jgi:hypothetical protein
MGVYRSRRCSVAFMRAREFRNRSAQAPPCPCAFLPGRKYPVRGENTLLATNKGHLSVHSGTAPIPQVEPCEADGHSKSRQVTLAQALLTTQATRKIAHSWSSQRSLPNRHSSNRQPNHRRCDGLLQKMRCRPASIQSACQPGQDSSLVPAGPLFRSNKSFPD